MRRTALTTLFALALSALSAQNLTDASTRWSDSFAEWVIAATPEPTAADPDPQPEEVARLKLRWPDRDRWTEWDIEHDSWRGTVRQKWDSDPNNWELRANGLIVTIRTRWTGDFSEWKIDDGTRRLVIKSRYTSPDEWLATDDGHGRFYMYTLYRGDARDWAIEDGLGDEIGEEMRMALVFTVLFNSTPNK